MKSFRAIVPAAGKGSRLKKVSGDLPKAMFPVIERPMLEYVLENISFIDENETYIIVGYGKEKIMDKREELSENVGKDIKEAKRYIEKHKIILSKYKIKEIYSYTDGGKLKVRLMFEDMSYEYLFGYYFRTNCIYLDSKRLLNILHRVVEKGKNGASEYLKWLEVVNILGKHGITMDWFRYFRRKRFR